MGVSVCVDEVLDGVSRSDGGSGIGVARVLPRKSFNITCLAESI